MFAADHGHILLQEIPAGDVVAGPPGEWKLAKRRCYLGDSLGRVPGTVVLPAAKVGINGPVAELVVPAGLRVFAAGEGYFHGGVSPQECVSLRSASRPSRRSVGGPPCSPWSSRTAPTGSRAG